MTTKNQTTAHEAAKTAAAKHVVKAGGAKGQAIVELLTKEPSLTRSQLAEKVGATVGRVGEVVRWLAANGTKEEKAVIAKHVASQPARKVAEKKAAPTKKAAAKPAAAKKASTRKPAAKPAEDPAPSES